MKLQPIRKSTGEIDHFRLETRGDLTDSDLRELQTLVRYFSSPQSIQRNRQRIRKRPTVQRPAPGQREIKRKKGLSKAEFEAELAKLGFSPSRDAR